MYKVAKPFIRDGELLRVGSALSSEVSEAHCAHYLKSGMVVQVAGSDVLEEGAEEKPRPKSARRKAAAPKN